ncbi:hypothetical protein H4R34_005830 [Dimargaris verticillata]|uniref:Uncharacterized protein n=1 Tax=Dimargaris verticillata TaxID=2761393 RepID=A0A9W8AXF4_9FUNG|nr:hypothetical protein H4R34_005830 [Dimargaris verticillata]
MPGTDDLYSDFLDDDEGGCSTESDSHQCDDGRLKRPGNARNTTLVHQQPPISRPDHLAVHYSRSSSPDSDANPMVTQEEDLDDDLGMPFHSGAQRYRLQGTAASHQPAAQVEASRSPPRSSLTARSASAFTRAPSRSDKPQAAALEIPQASTSSPANASAVSSEGESQMYDPAHYSPLVDEELDSDNPWANNKP